MNKQRPVDVAAHENAEGISKWIEAVLDLVKLTYRGEMVWTAHLSASPYYGTEYHSTLGDANFALSVFPTRNGIRETVAFNYALPLGINRYPRLSVVRHPNASPTVFPDIAPLDALAQAVQRQSQPEADEGILDYIHKIAIGEHAVGTDKISVTKYDKKGNQYE
jgi:hypothetical protein